jgi:RimJ/RimL family protein N-acetyltransferase
MTKMKTEYRNHSRIPPREKLYQPGAAKTSMKKPHLPVKPMTFSLKTGRLVLEDLAENDLGNLTRMARDPDVMRYVLVWLEDDEQIESFLRRGIDEAKQDDRISYMLAARVPGTGDFAGLTFLEIDPGSRTTGEVGIVLMKDYWFQGYAEETLRTYLSFGFGTLGLHRVFGKCDEGNHPSARLMERCGLQYEGTIREHVWLRDHWRSTRYYGMLAAEYTTLPP